MFQFKSAMTIAAFTCIFMALFMTRVSFPEGSFRSFTKMSDFNLLEL